jgi:Zn-dependent peptidase ImmA (M78 family)/DNA-binding XRE family transcriptional regulator
MSIFGQRLKSARIMAKLSMDQLVAKINNIVSKQAISKYENGIMLPNNSKIVINIAQALHVPVGYFYKNNEISLSDINFRKKASLGKKETASIKQRVKDYLERYFEIEELLNIDNKFENPLKEYNISYDPVSIENAALIIREAWKIGEKSSIASVVNLFEKNNIKIIELDVPEGFEGLSGYVNSKPFIVMKKDAPNDRKRFTAVHELAHLILNFKKAENINEKICHSFAGAFLITKTVLEELLGARNKISLPELITVKEQYGISIQAIMAREFFLGFISEYNYTNFNITFNKMRYRKNEPGDYCAKEYSDRFMQLIYHAVAEGVISISKAASLARKPISEIEKDISIID